jgi:hypothetical protein
MNPQKLIKCTDVALAANTKLKSVLMPLLILKNSKTMKIKVRIKKIIGQYVILVSEELINIGLYEPGMIVDVVTVDDYIKKKEVEKGCEVWPITNITFKALEKASALMKSTTVQTKEKPIPLDVYLELNVPEFRLIEFIRGKKIDMLYSLVLDNGETQRNIHKAIWQTYELPIITNLKDEK